MDLSSCFLYSTFSPRVSDPLFFLPNHGHRYHNPIFLSLLLPFATVPSSTFVRNWTLVLQSVLGLAATVIVLMPPHHVRASPTLISTGVHSLDNRKWKHTFSDGVSVVLDLGFQRSIWNAAFGLCYLWTLPRGIRALWWLQHPIVFRSTREGGVQSCPLLLDLRPSFLHASELYFASEVALFNVALSWGWSGA